MSPGWVPFGVGFAGGVLTMGALWLAWVYAGTAEVLAEARRLNQEGADATAGGLRHLRLVRSPYDWSEEESA